MPYDRAEIVGLGGAAGGAAGNGEDAEGEENEDGEGEHDEQGQDQRCGRRRRFAAREARVPWPESHSCFWAKELRKNPRGLRSIGSIWELEQQDLELRGERFD